MFNKQKLSASIQKFGRSLLLPIAVMAPMGMILGISNALVQSYMIERLPFLQNEVLQTIFNSLKSISTIIFGNIPLLFAMGVAYGMSKKDKGIAVFSSVISYLILQITINVYLKISGNLADAKAMGTAGQGIILGIQSLKIDAFGGIISGLIAANCTDKFSRKELPLAFAFFSGTKFVPIVTILFSIIAGFIVPFFWNIFSTILISMQGLLLSSVFGPAISLAVNRLLIPFGLHHVWGSMLRFTPAGGVYMINGKEYVGVLNALNEVLFNQGPGTEAWELMPSLTRFMAQNQMLLTLFMIPAVGLAMYHTAKPENRKYVKGIILTLVLTPFLGNITEPIEFSFLFIAPLLYGVYILLAAIGSTFLAILGTAVGYIRGTIFDFAIFGLLYPNTKWYNLFIVGIPLAIATYFIFKYLIVKWDIETPGREKDDVQYNELLANKQYDLVAKLVIEGLGGKENILSVENCVTRLRVDLKNMKIVDRDIIKSSGTSGIFFPTKNHIHLVFGPSVEFVRYAVEDELRGSSNR